MVTLRWRQRQVFASKEILQIFYNDMSDAIYLSL